MTETQALKALKKAGPFTISELMLLTRWRYNFSARQMELWLRRSLIVPVDASDGTRYKTMTSEEIIQL